MQNLRLFLEQLELVLAIIFSGRVSNPAIENFRVRVRNSLIYLTVTPVIIYLFHLIFDEPWLTMGISLFGAPYW